MKKFAFEALKVAITVASGAMLGLSAFRWSELYFWNINAPTSTDIRLAVAMTILALIGAVVSFIIDCAELKEEKG